MVSTEVILPQGTWCLSQITTQKLVVVAGGRAPAPDWLKQVASIGQLYCADKGLDYCWAQQLRPSLVCGDQDSGTTESWRAAETLGIPMQKYAPEKDATDLQLLLTALPSQSLVIATGIWGGRFDHLYANVYSLLAYQKKQAGVVLMADESEAMVLLTAGEQVTVTLQRSALAISLLPLAGENKVSISGVQWPLERATLTQTQPYAISNIALGTQVSAICHAGCMGFYCKF
ncbi:MAG: thiamine diphosphokinase [Acidaminococcaceae bacterium]